MCAFRIDACPCTCKVYKYPNHSLNLAVNNYNVYQSLFSVWYCQNTTNILIILTNKHVEQGYTYDKLKICIIMVDSKTYYNTIVRYQMYRYTLI